MRTIKQQKVVQAWPRVIERRREQPLPKWFWIVHRNRDYLVVFVCFVVVVVLAVRRAFL